MKFISTLACTGLVVGAMAGCSSTSAAHLTDTAPRQASWPVTQLHYTPNGNFGADGRYLPGADLFNLADVNTDAKGELDSLPDGVRGLVWLGACGGAAASFRSAVDAFAGDPKLFGFYVTDEPLPSTCPAANLLAEDNWIHAPVPGARTFAILENLGRDVRPDIRGVIYATHVRA